jgi:hypothetical protein
MLRRVAVLRVIIVLCLAAAEAQKKRAEAVNFDYAAVTTGWAQLLWSAQPATQRTQSAVEQPNAPQPGQQPHDQPDKNAAPPGPSPTEMPTAREQMMQLSVRIDGIHGAPQTLQRSQAGGHNLRSRFAEPASRMDGYIKGASDDPEDGGLALAKGFLEKAGRRVETPEKALNR